MKKLDLFENATETLPDDSIKADITDDILDFLFNLTKSDLSDIEGKDAAEQDMLKDSFKDVLSYISNTKTRSERKLEYSPEKIFNAITTNSFPGTKSNDPSPLLVKYQHILLLLSYIDKLDNYLRQLAKDSKFKPLVSYPYLNDDLTVTIFIIMELWFMEGTQKNIYKYLVQNHIKSKDTSLLYDPDSINEISHPFISINRKAVRKSIMNLLSIGKTNLDEETKEKIRQEADKLFPPKGDSKLSANEYSIPYSYAKTLNEHCRHCEHIVTPAKDSIETERCSLKLGCLECEHNKHPFNNLLSLPFFK